MKRTTIVILKTHIINDQVINEYHKMKLSGYEIVLMIDNKDSVYPDTGQSIGWLTWKNVNIHYMITKPYDYELLKLPCYVMNREEIDFSKIIWYNSDYSQYLARVIFPNYKFYWQFDYDCYLNARDYSDFFDKYSHNFDDLLISLLRKTEAEDKWMWSTGVEWAYKNVQMWGSFYPVVRLSGNAIDYLYRKRIYLGELFSRNLKCNQNIKWLFSEVFVPTEINLANFSMGNLELPNVVLTQRDKNDLIKKFSIYDGQLYHPVKDQAIYYTVFSCIHYEQFILKTLVDMVMKIECDIPKPVLNFKYKFAQFPIFGIRDVHFEFLICNNYIDSVLHFENKYESLFFKVSNEIIINSHSEAVFIKNRRDLRQGVCI